MRAQLEQYVNLLFAGTPDSEEMKQEILQNTLDRYDDLLAQGKTPEAAYRLAIGGIGDINEVLGSKPAAAAPTPAAQKQTEKSTEKGNRKLAQAVAIGMYICSVIPLVALRNIGNSVIGLSIMFLLIAGATALLVMNSDDAEDRERQAQRKSRQNPLDKALNTVALVLFLTLSFVTGAWHITWLIWPILACVKAIVRACNDLKGGFKA